MDSVPVVVVGAGPVGLATAAILAAHGVGVVVLERRSERATEAKASHIHGAVLEGFRGLGVIEALLKRGRPSYGACLFHDAELLSAVDCRQLDVRFPFSLALPQPEIEAVLEERAVALGAVVRRGCEVLDIASTEAPVVRYRDAEGERSVAAQWVVGCDGARSTVRDAMGSVLRGFTNQWPVALADVPTTDQLDHAQIATTDEGIALRIPLREGERWVVDLPAGAQPEQVVELLEQRVPHAKSTGPAWWSSPFRVHLRIANRWRRGRLLLAGDAAHLHSPVGGHGMNTGLFDAQNLGWKLARVVGGADPALLDSYPRERWWPAFRSVATAWWATFGLLRRGVLARLRRWSVRLGASYPWADALVARWSIGWDIALPGRLNRGRAEGIVAGRRAVDLRVADTWLLDTEWHGFLVVAKERPDAVCQALDARFIPAAGPYARAGVTIIRPDGFVGFVGNAADAADWILSLG